MTTDQGDRPTRLLRRLGFAFTCVYGTFGALFIAGEAVDDPGGAAALGLVAGWLLPLVALLVVAVRRPDGASRLFAALTVALCALEVSAVAAASTWRSFEDDVGPVRAVALFVLAVSLGVLGRHRTGTAGALLLTLGAFPVLLALLSAHGHTGAPLIAVSLPAALTGALYLAAGLAPHHTGRSDGRGHTAKPAASRM